MMHGRNPACSGCNSNLFLLNISFGCQDVCNWCIEVVHPISNTKAKLVYPKLLSNVGLKNNLRQKHFSGFNLFVQNFSIICFKSKIDWEINFPFSVYTHAHAHSSLGLDQCVSGMSSLYWRKVVIQKKVKIKEVQWAFKL